MTPITAKEAREKYNEVLKSCSKTKHYSKVFQYD